MRTNLLLLVGLVSGVALTLLMSYTTKEKEEVQYEYSQVTTIESVVSGGAGRSRMVYTGTNGEVQEDKMNNFFSMVGINFGNIRENDQMITEKISEMTNDGWELVNTNTGVYASESKAGIFITRYLYRKEK